MHEPPPPSEPRRPQHRRSPQEPRPPQEPRRRGREARASGAGRRPSAALVGGGLLLLVVLLALGAFLGTRAMLGAEADDDRPAVSQAISASIWSMAAREPSSTPMSSTVCRPSRDA